MSNKKNQPGYVSEGNRTYFTKPTEGMGRWAGYPDEYHDAWNAHNAYMTSPWQTKQASLDNANWLHDVATAANLKHPKNPWTNTPQSVEPAGRSLIQYLQLIGKITGK